MNTKQLVQTSANVIRITNVAPGNLYKRFELDSYDSDKVIFGVVKSVHNDGENTIIEATEYKKGYFTIEVSNKNITSKQEVVIFPCSLKEFNLEFESAKQQQENKIQDLEKQIKNCVKTIEDLDKLIKGETQKTLSEASYKELTQIQYNQAKQALN